MNRFVPDDWILTEKLRKYAQDKNLSEATIDDQALEWGKVTPVREIKYTQPQELSTEEIERDRIKAVTEMDEYRRKGEN